MPSPVILPTYTIGTWAANVDDDFGCRWLVSPGSSIADGPGVKLRVESKPFASGSYRADSFRDTRTITLQGQAQAADRASMLAARDRFLSLFPLGVQRTLVIDDSLAPKQVMVELANDPKVAIWSDATGFDWQLQLLATDPRYYGTTLQTASTGLPTPGATGLDWNPGGGANGLDWVTGGGLDWGTAGGTGTVSLTNTGNAETFPVFTLAGPLTLPFLTNQNTGQVLSYNGTLVSGDSLVIDCLNHTVLLNGADRFTLMPVAQWFVIPPYSSITVVLSGTAGSGTVTASWRSASW